MSSNQIEPTSTTEESQNSVEASDAIEDPMSEYYQLQQMLLLTTLILSGIIFILVWCLTSLDNALNYLLGAGVGLVYLRMLGKEVESLGQPGQRIGAKGLGIFVILIIVASKWQQLQILPVFLGFLTYKLAIVIYTVQSIYWSSKNVESDA